MIVTYKVNITSLTPLIVNRFHEAAAEEATSGTHGRKEYPAPHEDAASRLYTNEHSPFYPAENIRQSMIAAASRHKIGRRAATTDVAAGVYVSPFEIPLVGEWHVDSRAVVIKATGGRILRHRPMFDEWNMEFDVQIDTDLVGERLIRDILTDAGRLVGIGDFRPAKKGPYGRFALVSWEKVK